MAKKLERLCSLFTLSAVREELQSAIPSLEQSFSVFLFCSAGPNNYQPEFMAATSSCKSLSSHRQGSHRLMRFGPHSALNFPRSGPNLNCNFMTLVLVVVWASWPGPKGEIAGATGAQNFLRQHGSSIFCAFRGSRCCGFCDAASLAATN